MAYARVVTFEGVSQDAANEIRQEISQGERPEGIPATEILVLADSAGGKLQVITFYDTEDDYRQGDQTLQGMSPPQGMNRASVEKYEVTVRRTA
jgi:hypothetical protein